MRLAAVKTISAPVKPAFAALVFMLASIAFTPEASALPGVDRAPAAQGEQGLQKVRWVCGPYRCWRQPGYGGPGYGYGWGSGYGGWGPGYGWGGGWRRRYW